MQTPAGFTIDDLGVLHVADWWEVIFNPSFPYRFAHMVAAAYLTTAFIVAGIGAWYLLRGAERAAWQDHARHGLEPAGRGSPRSSS